MIVVVNGTNRKANASSRISEEVMLHLRALAESDVKMLSLEEIPLSGISASSYQNPPEVIVDVVNQYFANSNRIVFVLPEYNGSFPGVLKLVIDLMSTVGNKELLLGKEVLLIGVAAGGAGNLIGLSHFSTIVQHMGGRISAPNLPISSIDKQFDEVGLIKSGISQIILNRLAEWMG